MNTRNPSDQVKDARKAEGAVVVYSPTSARFDSRHERITRIEIAKRLAVIKGFSFAGEYDASNRYPGRLYFVPGDTIGKETAIMLGVRSEHDLYGGVVPHPFVATKAITHPLVGTDAVAPAGWSNEFAHLVRNNVAHGFTVFAISDGLHAGACLLEDGPVRIKPVNANGGRDQIVVHDNSELAAALDAINWTEVSCDGLVLEENLSNVVTYSVGEVRVAELVITYYGVQRLTRDNIGNDVYGGSDILAVRGGFSDLAKLDLAEEPKLAIAQARAYDAAAMECFPGLLASRRNYDVAHGVTGAGRSASSVLEQSWRIGGASTAEIAALEAFRANPGLRNVRASSIETYGENNDPPDGAAVYFHGVDYQIGPVSKYALVQPL